MLAELNARLEKYNDLFGAVMGLGWHLSKVRCHPSGMPTTRGPQGVWPEVEQGLAKAGVETISIWSDPMDDCALYMYLGRWCWCLQDLDVAEEAVRL